MKSSHPLLFNSQTILKEKSTNYLKFTELKNILNLASRSKSRKSAAFDLLRVLATKANLCKSGKEIKPRSRLMEIFTCKCGSLLHDPCTLPCGHTICKMCFMKAEFCVVCGSTCEQGYILNVTLASILERCLPDQYKAADFRRQAKEHIDVEKYEQALKLLTQSLVLMKNDSLTLRMRAEVNLKLSRTKFAYRDARKSCDLNPQSGESLFILGSVCAALNKLDDAVEAYQKCLECDPDDASLYEKVCEQLDSLLSMQLGPEIEISDEDSEDESTILTSNRTEKLNDVHGKSVDSGQLTGENTSTVIPSNPESESTSSQNDKHVNKSIESCPDCEKYQAEQSNETMEEVKKTAHCSNCLKNKSGSLTEPNRTPIDMKETEKCKDSESCITNQTSWCGKRNHDPEGSQAVSTNKKMKTVSSQSPSIDDFECKLCFCLIYQPVTTPCGHVFCKICLERCIDHNPSCPICRKELAFNENGVGEITKVIQEATKYYFPEELNQRSRKNEEYMEKMARVGDDEDVEVPIFACILVFPTIQYQFHIFEPRYRLMLRECFQSGSKKFGICISNKDGAYSKFGTIVEVKFCKFLPDGRSIIDVVGVRRFEIADKRMSNGIPVAKVKYFEDNTETYGSDIECEQLTNKCMAGYNQLADYIGKLHPSERDCINKALGPLPLPSMNPAVLLHGESWVWWATAALPLNDNAKLMMFKSHSVLNRVIILQRFLTALSKVRNNRQATESL